MRCSGRPWRRCWSGLAELPEPQANAIRAALALGPSPGVPGDRFATCAAFLSLLARAAEREPLLVVVDDAQWLDSPSAECLAYAARRLAGTRVALLAASRPTSEGPLLGSDVLERLNLSGLGSEDARALLRASTPEATSSVVDSLLEIAAGNPLALRELPAQLSRGPTARAGADRPCSGGGCGAARGVRVAACGAGLRRPRRRRGRVRRDGSGARARGRGLPRPGNRNERPRARRDGRRADRSARGASASRTRC